MLPLQPIHPGLLATGAAFTGEVLGSLPDAGVAGAAGRPPFIALDGRGPEPVSSFAGLLGRLVDDTRARDVEAQQAVEAFARSDDPGRIHETMVAVSKAEISLRTVATVRNKLLDAYRSLLQVNG